MTTATRPTRRQFTPRLTEYIPYTPHPTQQAFLLMGDNVREAIYGGAAGGGKSDALLMAALQYVDVPGYAALLLRRTFADLKLPGALMDRAQLWLGPTKARWQGVDTTWTFPSGATLTFGYLQYETDKFRYQSSEFQFIGFDELTQFTETQYRYLFSRLRRKIGVAVPLRMRSASNPGGIGHDWVKRRFGLGEAGPDNPWQRREALGRYFLPAKLADNPSLDAESYLPSLAELDPTTRQQLLEGDWSARAPGSKFRREWFDVVPEPPVNGLRKVRRWDLAATEAKGGKDPDWTAGALVGLDPDGVWWVLDMKRIRARPHDVERLIKMTADLDGLGVMIRMEQEPGASGVGAIDHYQRQVLVGRDFRGIPSTGAKEVRANPVSSAAEAGNVKIVAGPWNSELLDELEGFPGEGLHDDQVDAISGAFADLAQGTPSVRFLG